MKVVNDKHTYFVRWKYESPKLMKLLQVMNITIEEAVKTRKEGGCPALAHLLDVKALPLPTVTKCIISNEAREELVIAEVRKFPGDAKLPADKWDKDKARKYSLDKAVRKYFPGDENKPTRRVFWDTYLTRTMNLEHTPVEEMKMIH